MIKVFIILASVTALVAYFLNKPFASETKADKHTSNKNGLQMLTALPSQVKESSGIAVLSEQGQYITQNDAGNKPYLYKINEKGNLLETIKLDLPNVDWEDLSRDDEGNIYIADTGNNDNNRRELAIYKVNPENPSELEAIRFTYEDQKEYPPAKKDMNFDCEAIFWHNGTIYLVSKDRGRKQTAKVYSLSDKQGQQKAKLLGSVELKGEVTGAALSPEADKIALLTEGKLHLFSDVSDPATFYKDQFQTIPLKDAGQTEGIAFEDANTLVITSEGGNLYKYSLN
ncbi:hypothetical protein [Pontibacter vulgaris]|uniref:hypothetical protein n=1 Tax=Pontibacter vulgaris TaxID=2905679 RepID=UPI001FA6E72C|nr:hypothetical protein [Pontibacter vulgaris]